MENFALYTTNRTRPICKPVYFTESTMAITKIHAVKVRLGDAINYIENPDKTDGQELISGYNTAPQTAVLDFSVTAAMARKARNTNAKYAFDIGTLTSIKHYLPRDNCRENLLFEIHNHLPLGAKLYQQTSLVWSVKSTSCVITSERRQGSPFA